MSDSEARFRIRLRATIARFFDSPAAATAWAGIRHSSFSAMMDGASRINVYPEREIFAEPAVLFTDPVAIGGHAPMIDVPTESYAIALA